MFLLIAIISVSDHKSVADFTTHRDSMGYLSR